MKQFKIGLLLIIMLIFNGVIFAGDNTIKYVPGFKVGKGIATLINDIEYERNLIPFTSAYIRFGGASFNVPRDAFSDLSASFTNFSIGMRYNLLLFYVGIAYESSNIKLSDSLINSSAKGTVVGPAIEIGKKFGLGPISLGGSLGLQFASFDIDFEDSIFDIGDIKTSGSDTLIKAEVFFGILF